MIDSPSIHELLSFPNASIPYNSVASYLNFMLFVLSKEIKFLITYYKRIWPAFQGCLIPIDFTIDFVNPFKYLPM